MNYPSVSLRWSYTSNKIAATCNKIWFQRMLIECLHINYKSQGNMCRHFYLKRCKFNTEADASRPRLKIAIVCRKWRCFVSLASLLVKNLISQPRYAWTHVITAMCSVHRSYSELQIKKTTAVRSFFNLFCLVLLEDLYIDFYDRQDTWMYRKGVD